MCPTINGAAQVGETLTASTTGISDGDGLDDVTFAYQWLAGDAEINGATASAYILAEDDAGKAVKVRVNFTDDAGNEESLTSAATGTVATPPNTPATGAPTISGRTQVGETLTAGTSNISDGDGLDDAAFAYQWLADDAEINGATASAYTLAGDDEGKAVKVRVSFTDDAGNYEALTSDGTEPVASQTPPNTPAEGAPAITGTARVGETLTVDTSGISDAEGMGNAVFTYRWISGGTDIPGATGASYTLTEDDEGLAIQVWVSFTDDAGNPEALTSAATAAVAPPGPAARTSEPDGHGQPGRLHNPELGSPRRRQHHWLPDPAPEAYPGGGHPAVVRGGHREHRHHLHGHQRHGGCEAHLPGQGDQRGGRRPRLQLRQRDPLGLERDGRGQWKHPQYMRRARCSPIPKRKMAPPRAGISTRPGGRPPQGSYSPPLQLALPHRAGPPPAVRRIVRRQRRRDTPTFRAAGDDHAGGGGEPPLQRRHGHPAQHRGPHRLAQG